MKTKNYLLPVLLIILTGLSCQDKKQNYDPIETISIDVRNMKPEMDLTYAIDTSYFEIIPLETTDDCLIAKVKRIYLSNNKIVVYDEMAQGAYIFNRDGSYHAKVRAIGQGPGEYPPPINDIMVSENHIGVLSPPFGIMLYDFDGKFVRRVSLEGSWGMNLFTFDDTVYYLVNDWSMTDIGYYLFFSLDTKQNRVRSFLPFSKRDIENRRGWGLDKYYNLYDNSASIYFSTIDTIFHLSPASGEITPRYAIDMVYKNLPDNLKRGDGYKAVYSAIDNGYYKGIRNVLETSRYLFLRIDGICVVYDKQEKTIKTIAGVLHRIPSFFNHGIQDFFSLSEGDYIINYHTGLASFNNKKYLAELIADKTIENGEGRNAFEKAYFKVLENVKDEEDNPTVFIFKMKD